jgi:hypothetical protein
MDLIDGGQGWVALVGGLLLAAVLLWAMLRNKSQPRDAERRADEGAARLRAELDREGEAAQSPRPLNADKH